jgi:hypothetical protein
MSRSPLFFLVSKTSWSPQKAKTKLICAYLRDQSVFMAEDHLSHCGLLLKKDKLAFIRVYLFARACLNSPVSLLDRAGVLYL